MKVDAKALHQAVKNVSLFAKKGGWADAVKVETQKHELAFTSCDDYVGVTSRVTYSGAKVPPGEFFISPQSVKDLEKCLRNQDGELEANLGIHNFTITEEEFVAIDCPDPEWWGMFDYVMDHVYAFPQEVSVFEISGDRLTQMSRLEPKGEYPVAFGHCDVDGRGCVAFKYGPDTYGMIMPLDREALRKAYGDKFKEVVF